VSQTRLEDASLARPAIGDRKGQRKMLVTIKLPPELLRKRLQACDDARLILGIQFHEQRVVQDLVRCDAIPKLLGDVCRHEPLAGACVGVLFEQRD